MNATKLIDPQGNPVTSRVSQPMRRSMGGFRGASWSDPDLAAWNPPNYSAYGAHYGDRIPLTARIHDLARNDGWISSGVTKKVDAIIGAQWRLNAMPNWRALGIDRAAASDLADAIEAEWKAFASDDCDFYIDAARQTNFTGLMTLAYRHRMLDGEALAVMDWRPVPGCAYATCVAIVDPSRLSNPMGTVDTLQLRDGVQRDLRGAAEGYFIRNVHPGEPSEMQALDQRWTFYPRQLPHGRRVVIHAFKADRAGQVRGVSQMASLIKKAKNLGRYDEAELQAALINAVMAAVVESPFDHEQMASAMSGGEELSAYQQQRLDYYEAAPISLGGAKTLFTYPGEKLTFTKPEHPNAVFENYIRAGLRNIAAVLGETYEQFSGDWSQSNYSSARGALVEAWRGFTTEREFFGKAVAQPIYSCWLEEAIDRGRIKLPAGAPDFYEARAAWTAATWTGPGRGWVDPLKEAQAAALRVSAGLSTFEDECAEQGKDYREVLAQIARERDEMKSLGLDPADFRVSVKGGPPATPPDQQSDQQTGDPGQ